MSSKWFSLVCLALLLGGCDVQDDLLPSGSDERPTVSIGTVGIEPGQIAADFTLSDSLGNPFTLSDQLAGGAQAADAVVLYFTMWCPICLGHSDHLLWEIEPRFRARGTVRYVLVDYVSGSVVATRSSEVANGYSGSIFTTLADSHQALFRQFDAAMGTTIVIAADGTIWMNEDYKDGSKLSAMLDGLLP